VLIDGKAYAQELRGTLREELSRLPATPGIGTLLVGDDLAAQVYQRRIDRHARCPAWLQNGVTRVPGA
jgi:5,10-methylene-tetrahydrofolate dehydrogenase/methenyl tetrahydrofolate cyclohydrolase